ncbi:MAG: glycine zipper 2TM domain-containing protein [Deltaproteobacteria bacterium]
MKKMKNMLAILAAGAMLVSAVPMALAADRGVNGLILGAGSGAIFGQAISRNTEGTLLGTVVGGVIGYAIGSEMARHPVRHEAGYPAGRVIIERGRSFPGNGRFIERHHRHPWRQPVFVRVHRPPQVVVIKKDRCCLAGERFYRKHRR